MSFDVKNIEQDNIDFKKLAGIFMFLILCIAGAAIFVYYWFTLDKRAVIQEQYLGQKSDSYEEHKNEQLEFMEKEYVMSIDDAKNIIAEPKSK
tara:strand:- start:361 stop:639 length:279 start_codon:yes stop_codon:yes gene_type:complete